MTRVEQFDTNIKQPLLQMRSEVENLNVDDLDASQKLEFARAKKVLAYIENYTSLLDPDLLPQTFYTQIQSKTQSWNKTIPHLNQVLDEILFYLASYGSVYIPKNQVSSAIDEMIKAYSSAIKQFLQEVDFSKIKRDAKAIENYGDKLLSADDSIQSQIASSQIQIQTWFNEIQKFNNAFFVKQDNKETSIKADIDFIQNDINSTYKQLHDIVMNFTQKLTDLDEFYVKIFGTVENNQRIGGLQQEIKDRQKQLDEYNEEQKTKFESLRDEIENLLKDATNASLASSYEKSKESYTNAIYGWNAIFILSMLSIVGVAFWGFMEVVDKLSEPLAILGAILVRLPFTFRWLGWLFFLHKGATNQRDYKRSISTKKRLRGVF